MALPFTVEQFHGMFQDCNASVWPVQWVLVALALAATVAALRPRLGSGIAVSVILGLIAVGVVGLCLLLPLGRSFRARAS